MDKRQQDIVESYSEILKNKDVDLAMSVGRHSDHLGLAEDIWADVSSKLNLKTGCSLLDIGCGFGEVTEFCLKTAKQLDMQLHLVDIPEAVKKIQSEMRSIVPKNTFFWGGVFPEVTNAPKFPKKFDLILVYSVLHCTDYPEEFVEKTVSLLVEGGQLLLGDLPNVHRKGRFLSSDQGRRFEAEYRQVAIEKIPEYKNQFDFFERCDNQNKKINDDFISNTVSTYRSKGYHVYVLPQPEGLPFCKTREDVLIVSP
ncbi:class I SAM-dependent methyltransferase [Nitrosomonadales bacterium]|nr:class I SAM-dependent methyltransferase [Nitrosomonadales bacterium]